jgi:Bacterial self-protective colicin-like immunity
MLITQMINNIEKEEMKKYLLLLSEYVSEQISSIDFETKYLKIYTNDSFYYSMKTHESLAMLSSDVDAYCFDSGIRDKDDLDEKQLLQRATHTLCKLTILLLS